MQGVNLTRDRASILLVLAGLSGICGIAYEVLYVRQIGIAIGDVWYVALAVMMSLFAGMAIGALAGRRCLRWLPAAEALLGVHALAMAAWSATGMHIPAFVPPEFVAHPLGGVLLTVVVMTPAAVLMGLGIALFSLWRATAGNGVQQGFAGAYLAYNAGAAGGLLAVAFWLIPGIGVAMSLVALATLNGVVALSLWRVGLAPDAELPREQPIGWREPLRLGVVGIAGALVQSICLKVAYLVLGPHPAQYALTLALALAAIAIGTAVVERFRIGFNRWLIMSLFMVGAPFAATGVGLPAFSAAPAGAGVWIWAAWTALPLIAVGGTVAAWVRSSVESGSTPGAAIAAVAGGNAIGYAFVMLVVEPFLADALLVALPIIVLAAGLVRRLPPWRVALAGAVPVALLAGVVGAAWPGDALHWSAQAIRNADTFERYQEQVESTTIYNDWGRSATITRLETTRHLSTRGYHSMAIRLEPDPREGMVSTTRSTESGVAMTARAMAENNGSALVVGLGAGLTASVAEALFDRLDVVEINPAMADVVDAFSDLNWDFPSEDTTRVLWRDGLTHLRRTDRTYDAIINTSTSPANGSSTKLFTEETIRAARDRLNAGGVYVTWLDSRLPKTEAHSLIRTVESVFADCAYRPLTRGYMLMICGAETDTPRAFDISDWPEHVRARIPGLNDRHRAKFIAAQTFADVPDMLRPPDGPVAINTLDRPTVGVEPGFQWGLWQLRLSGWDMSSPSPLLQPDGTVMRGNNRCPAMQARGIRARSCRDLRGAS